MQDLAILLGHQPPYPLTAATLAHARRCGRMRTGHWDDDSVAAHNGVTGGAPLDRRARLADELARVLAALPTERADAIDRTRISADTGLDIDLVSSRLVTLRLRGAATYYRHGDRRLWSKTPERKA